MTIPAAGSLNVTTEQTQLRAKGVVLSGELVFVTRPADRRGLHAEGGFSGLQNCVCRVAVRADRGFEVAFGDAMAVRSTLVVVVDLCVTRAAGLRDVRFEGVAPGIFAAQDAVRSVATLAIGSDQQAFLAQCITVDRIHVVRIDAGQALLRGHCAVAVALAARPGDVERVDCGPRVGLRIDFMRAAVTACAWVFF